MKKSTLVKLHLYCGLFTSFYLISFGLSSIILNHKFDLEKKAIKKTWAAQVQVDTSLSQKELAEEVRNQLNLMGWVPPWEFRKRDGHFQFITTHLAKTSKLDLDLASGRVEVAEMPKGFLEVLHALHFFNGRIPNAPFVLRTWIVYQWMTLFVLLVSLILGLWLWLRYSHKTWELYVFGGLFIFSLLLMFLI